MPSSSSMASRNRWFLLSGLGIALLIAGVLSPFASQHPDGLERVAQDQGFAQNATKAPIAQKLPFATVFNEYSFKGVPAQLATPLAGVVGTLVTFGLAWGIGKFSTEKSQK